MKKNILKKLAILILAVVFVVSFALPTFAADNEDNSDSINEKLGVPIVVYGGTLTAAQKQEVRDLLKIKNPKNTAEYEVTGADIAKYINGDPNSRMFSSAKITREEKGKGLKIDITTPENITEVTSEMYANALLTAGVEDATVEVVSPVKVSGHSALTGIYKAYDVSGVELDKDRMELANEELEVATDLASKDGMDNETASQLLTEIKKAIADQKPATKEDVEKIVNEQLNKLEIKLNDADRQMLIDLFEKMRHLNIDFGKVKGQLNDITSKVKDKFNELGIDQGFWEKLMSFLERLISGAVNFFKGIFG